MLPESSSSESEGGPDTAEGPRPRAEGISRAEGWLLLILAAVQLTHILDFMIVMPLQPHMKGELHMEPIHFGIMVSAYGFSASLAGLLAAGLIDRFDRKRALLVLYAGFTAGTVVCAIAPGYAVLVLGRVIAGAFGGVAGALLLAIVGDVFADGRRGRAMGVLMSAFSVAAIAGVPAGLLLADHFDWRTPFAALAGLSAAVLALAACLLPPLRGHLRDRMAAAPSLWEVFAHPTHLRAYGLMVALVVSGFSISPFMADYFVANVGLAKTDLKYIYLCGGAVTLFTLTPIGGLADRVGKLPVFRCFAWLTMVTLLAITYLPPVPLPVVLVLTTVMMVVTSGRMVPAMAMITASAAPSYRGSFLSVNSAVQQTAIGVASLIAGALLSRASEDAPLVGFHRVGWLAAAATVVSIVLAGQLRPAADDRAVDTVEETEEAPEAALV